ncbi:hypothetical protein DER44DRAFT_798050 [Fusarium oxysporum]|nr:hypothetical protein DER44DRAFT_798050 [Fusarium oxysporum]
MAATPIQKDDVAPPGKLQREKRRKTATQEPLNVRRDAPATRNKYAKPKSHEQDVGQAQPQPSGDALDDIDPSSREDVAIDDFIDHRVDTVNSTVDIKVQWEGGETTWESEWSLQEQVPALVFKYWKNRDSREAATNLDVYHVFKILNRTTQPGKSKGDKFMYEVQWVGYPRTDSTWEYESKLRMISPGELEKFEAEELASGASNKKRKSTSGPGRPRKKPRVKD